MCSNPPQMVPCKSLNAVGKWAFLPRLIAPQRWSTRLPLCNSTSCSVPAKSSLKHFSHDLGIKKGGEKKKNTTPFPLHFSPICGEIIFRFRIPWEWETARKRKKCSLQCQWIIGSLLNPIRKDGVETYHSVLHRRIRAAAALYSLLQGAYCIALLISSLWLLGHSRGINPTVIMLVRVTRSAACVETPVILWLQCSALGVLPASTFSQTHMRSPNWAVPRTQRIPTHPGLLPSHQSACLIRTANSPFSTKGTITEAMIFSL